MTEDEPKCTIARLAALEQRMVAMEHLVELHRSNAATSLAKADEELRTRLTGLNEFRAAISDQNARFLTRAEIEAKLLPLEDIARKGSEIMSNWQGRAWAVGTLATAAGGVIGAAVGSVVAYMLRN